MSLNKGRIEMLFNCEFCGEQGMELKEGVMLTPWHPTQEKMGAIEMECVECGVRELCESDDLVGFMMEILDEKNYQKAMIKTLKILWNEKYLKDVTE